MQRYVLGESGSRGDASGNEHVHTRASSSNAEQHRKCVRRMKICTSGAVLYAYHLLRRCHGNHTPDRETPRRTWDRCTSLGCAWRLTAVSPISKTIYSLQYPRTYVQRTLKRSSVSRGLRRPRIADVEKGVNEGPSARAVSHHLNTSRSQPGNIAWKQAEQRATHEIRSTTAFFSAHHPASSSTDREGRCKGNDDK